MNVKKHLHGRSWKTTTVGIIVIIFGLVAFSIHWVPMQLGTFKELYFNLFYAEIGPIAILCAGFALILARDHSCTSAHIKERCDAI
jgi:multisubunit Na+/H+ antiporter MnhG subunit